MRESRCLSGLEWVLMGSPPYQWMFDRSMETGAPSLPETPRIPARVPGSVQGALRDAGIIPDWNQGLNARLCEWVEHRHWAYETVIPKGMVPKGTSHTLRCMGLDYRGRVYLNGREVGCFANAMVPHAFAIDGVLDTGADNTLRIVFEQNPPWLGQFGYTSRMTEWKPRFYYTWDWVSRLVQTGVWGEVFLEATDGEAFGEVSVRADADPETGLGMLRIGWRAEGHGAAALAVVVERDRIVAARVVVDHRPGSDGWCWHTLTDMPVELWHPNGCGEQALYSVGLELLDADGRVLDTACRTVGFRHVEWLPCHGAPEGADPWICSVNGVPVFLQGVNWTPLRPNFADDTGESVRNMVRTYSDLGCNLLRVWGGAVLERESFYDECDRAGIMVWQEFPLSSSGLENWPPEDDAAISEMSGIVRCYIRERGHHASLIMWCGGNELQGGPDGSKTGTGLPVDDNHPMMAMMKGLVAEYDPGRRFVPTSSSGPSFYADASDYGKGLHWDVHGPWQIVGTMDDWREYWRKDDALFRSETGCPGASPVDIIEGYAGDLPVYPGDTGNPLWRRTSWWVEWPRFIEEVGREPVDLGEYVEWSQGRQAEALAIAVSGSRRRFPGIGGILLWMGHDCFPCTANTSIIDFHGRPKPAALAVARVFKGYGRCDR